ncbi:MAG: hypothetical protein ABWZ76_08255 [Acidimicrobiales bacterium]
MDDTRKPYAPPVTVTAAPGTAENTIGALGVPDLAMVTAPTYVPDETSTVWPATATLAARLIVQNG